MKNLDIDSINKLDWSNPYLDFLITIKLILLTYESYLTPESSYTLT